MDRMTPRAWVEAYLALRASLSAPRSSAGAALERARVGLTGTDDGALYASAHRAQERQQRFGHWSLVWAALTPIQRELLELQHTPTAHPVLTRERRLVDLRDGDGHEIVRHLHDEATGDLTGWVLVRERVPQAPTYEQLAERIGKPRWWVARQVGRAYDTIRERLAA